jgi:hypothetical protein
MSKPSKQAIDAAHIDAILDDPMIRLIMTVDQIEREDARQLFCRVATRLAPQPLPRPS